MTWLLNSAAAIDARHHTYPRRHDLAAGAIRTLMQYPPKQLMTIRGTLMLIRVKQTINDNLWYINGNSCKNKQPMPIHCNRISSIPLRVDGKVVILRREIPVRGCVPNYGEVTDYMTGFFIAPRSCSRSIGHAFRQS
jgi:hypothetical protein